MRPSSIAYKIKQGVKNIGRNKMFSIASIATMTACIFIFGVFFAIILNINAIRTNLEEKVGITVFFDEGISEEEIENIGMQIRWLEHVTEVTYTSADEAWENYKQEYFGSNPELAEGFKENPLANSASYTVLVDQIEYQDEVVEQIKAIKGVRTVNQSSGAAKNLKSFNRLFAYASIAIIAILLIVSVILISNTVSVGIAVRKDEIAIMKLIGATDSFVRGPFVIEGLLLGLIGTVLPLGILYVVYNWLLGRILGHFGFLNSMGDVLPNINTVFSYLVPVALVLGLGIGLIGARITVRRHLNV